MLGPTLDPVIAPRIAHLVEGWWSAPVTGSDVVIPDGAIDLMWAEGTMPWIAGPDTEPKSVKLAPGTSVVGVRLRTGVAQVLLRDSVQAATDRLVPVDDVWNAPTVEQLGQQLQLSRTPHEAAIALTSTIEMLVPTSWAPDDLVAAALLRIRRGEPLAELPVSERQLRRRFTAAMGYGPTFFRRIHRLERFASLASSSTTRSNAQVAAMAGYFDEAHLWRDAKALTGSTPTQLRR